MSFHVTPIITTSTYLPSIDFPRVLLTHLRPTGAEPGRIRGAEDGREAGLLQGGVLETRRCERCVSFDVFRMKIWDERT